MTEQPAIITRPTQAEVNYSLISAKSLNGFNCENCRWFIKEADGGPSCHLIELGPTDISPAGMCQRHEDSPSKEAAPEVVAAPEPEIEVPQFIEDRIEDVRGMIERSSERIDRLAIDTNELISKQATLYERTKARIDETFARFLGNKDDIELTGLKVRQNQWFITWSNNFEDREGEIFTAKAIDDYVARVDAGFVPLPTLRVWHIGKSTDIGQAEMVGRHGHFLIAAGTFYDGKAAQNAKAYYAKNARKTAVSHGFTFAPKHFDGKHFHQFNTFEISLLPRGKEANSYTSLDKVKEMPLTDEKKTYLTELFQDEVPDILAKLDENGKALEEANVAFKEFAVLDDSAVNIETEAAKEAVANADKDFKTLAVDLIGDVNTVLTMNAAAMKSMAAYKTATDATIAKQDATIAALKLALDDRPRSASKDEATELTPERIAQMNDAINEQSKTIHPLWGTEVSSLT